MISTVSTGSVIMNYCNGFTASLERQWRIGEGGNESGIIVRMSSIRRTRSNGLLFWSIVALLGFSGVLGMLWRFSPLQNRFGLAEIVHYAQTIEGHFWTPLAIMGIYVAAGLILFAHALVLWATVLIFDPWHALLYCELGTLASGFAVYGLGRIVREESDRSQSR